MQRSVSGVVLVQQDAGWCCRKRSRASGRAWAQQGGTDHSTDSVPCGWSKVEYTTSMSTQPYPEDDIAKLRMGSRVR